MKNALISFLNLIGKQSVAQLSGPWAFVAGLALKLVITALDYLGVKHELKKQSEDKLEAFEKAIASVDLTEEQKNEARKNFLK